MKSECEREVCGDNFERRGEGGLLEKVTLEQSLEESGRYLGRSCQDGGEGGAGCQVI